jgi:hypothetical protein
MEVNKLQPVPAPREFGDDYVQILFRPSDNAAAVADN